MNYVINNIITGLNNIGYGFWGYAVGMFVQSSVLIVLLLIIDFFLRKRVRAVFRYCIWMLVFVKLILPASFTLPTGVGYWLSDYWPKETIVSAVKQQPTSKQAVPVTVPVQSEVTSPEVTTAVESVPAANETVPNQFRLEALSWQAMIFTGWLVGVLVLSALLIQRVFFVRALIAQSKPAKGRLLETLEQCRSQFGIRKNVKLRLSDNSISPAVCGLFKPIVLMPTGLLEKLSREKLQAVLIHELAHIKRADIWVNLVQTLLQIVYFYNPFVWLANMIVRRIREQAVDEMVLVSLKQGAKTYSNTLIDIGEMAFLRPNLSLRLVGVVESKKALQRRIKHMLSRPIPKTAKLGIAGLLAVIIIGCAVLPMAKADKNKTGSNNIDSKSKQSKFIATLSNGVTVELVGVCEHPSEGKQWWRPDGSLLDTPLYKTTGSKLQGHEGYTYYEFAARMQGPSDTSMKWDVPHGRQGSYTGSPIGFDGKRVADLKIYTVNQPNENETVLVRIGLSSAPWETLATHKPEDDEETYTLDDGAAAFGQAYEKDGETFLPVVHNLQKKRKEQAFQVVAITNSGREFKGGGTGSGGNVLHSSTCNFNLPLKEVREFQFQTRPYQWGEFKNVSLKPKHKTDVQIEVEKPAIQVAHPVEFEITNQQFLQGDSIEITEILGTSSKIETGQTYTIKGKYKLSSHNQAMLHIYATNGQTHSEQGPVVDKGTGDFARTFTYQKDGWLHLSFYPADGGSSFGNLYFAQKGSGQKPLNIAKVTSVVGTPKNEMKRSKVTDKEAIVNKLKILQEQRQRVEGDLADVEKALDNVRDASGITDLEEHSYPHPITARLTRLQEERDECVLEISQLRKKKKITGSDSNSFKKAEADLILLHEKFEQLDKMVEEAKTEKKNLDLARSVYKQRVSVRDERREMLNNIKSQIEKLRIRYEEAGSSIFKKDQQAKKTFATTLLIEVAEDGEDGPESVSLRIPLAGLKVANTLIPKQAQRQMNAYGITLEEIIKKVEDGLEPTVLLEVKEKNSQVTISLE